MLTKDNILSAAQSLQDAEQQRVQIQSISITYPDMDLSDAYAVQQAWVDLKLAAGGRVLGRKIGLTSRAMQQVMQINEPDFGTLLDDMLFDDGADIEAARFTDPRVEVELAFVLGADLIGDNLTIVDVINATDYVVPAVELIAARTHRIDPNTGKPRGVLDTISDNAANAGIVLGGRPVKPYEVDLRWVGALLYKNGVIEESGVSAAVLNHPANVRPVANLHCDVLALDIFRLRDPGCQCLVGNRADEGNIVAAKPFLETVGQRGHLRAEVGPLVIGNHRLT